MTDLVLHHHDPSPFAEKIRLVFGIKGLTWSSVQVPMTPPRPELDALAGGYRKIPVLQVGADLYCDTGLIAEELERRHPKPGLFPAGHTGLARALSRWSDTAFFNPGAGLSMGENPNVPEVVLEDRKRFFNFLDFDRLAETVPHLYAQFQAQCRVLEDELAAGEGPYLLGRAPAWVDILAWFPVWMARGNVPRAAELLEPFPALRAWAGAMERVGHGDRSEMDPAEALEAAARSEPAAGGEVPDDPFHSFRAGDRVTVTPDDYGAVPVTGRLRQLDHRRIVIDRHSDRLGALAVHFPRAGFVVEAA